MDRFFLRNIGATLNLLLMQARNVEWCQVSWERGESKPAPGLEHFGKFQKIWNLRLESCRICVRLHGSWTQTQQS